MLIIQMDYDNNPYCQATSKEEDSMGLFTDAKKGKNHERIVRTASKRFSGKGSGRAWALPILCRRLASTVGGFYKHFDSRDDLVVEALRYGAQYPAKSSGRLAATGGPPLDLR